MNALCSRRELTSEISIFDTQKGSLCQILRAVSDLQHRFGHIFLAKQEINKQEIERDQLEPEVIHRLTDEQKHKQDQHPDICHQKAPPLEHRAGQISIIRSYPVWNFALKRFADEITQRFQAWCQHLLLAGKVQIQCEQQLLPRCVTPAQLREVRLQFRRGIYTSPRSRCYKVKIGAAIIISRCSLQCMTDPGSKREKKDGWRRAFEQTTEGQVQVNAHKDQVVGNAVNDTASTAFTTRQTRKLPIGIIECIRANMEHHPCNVDT